MPEILLAAIETPIPEPQIKIPRSVSPLDTLVATEAAISG
jgi:hypothetical protein